MERRYKRRQNVHVAREHHYVRQESIYDIVRANMPDPSYYQLDSPPGILYAATFDEIVDRREDLQSFRLVITRKEKVSEWYKDLQTVFKVLDEESAEVFPNGVFEELVTTILKENPMFLSGSDAPYDLPEASANYILWYNENVSLEDRIHGLGTLFKKEGIGKRDFVIIANPTIHKSVKTIPHYLVLTRRPLISQTRQGMMGALAPELVPPFYVKYIH